jgi:hypothetical protein
LGKAFAAGLPALAPAQRGRFATSESLEQRDQLPKWRRADKNVDDARLERARAKQRGHQIEVEEAHEAPVQAADDEEDKSNHVQRFY